MHLFEAVEQLLVNAQANNRPPLLAIVGPTASGKTALSIALAKHFNGEIISADSRQVYRQMDIGTDKISRPAMQGVTHHLIDVVDPNQEFTLADFKRHTLKAIDEITKRQHLPILCGGTGLYINAIIHNYQIPKVAPQFDLRRDLTAYASEHGQLALYNILKEKDPEAASKIHPNNLRYVIRALEINLAGGSQKNDQKGENMFEIMLLGIDWPREKLYERINGRAAGQIERGLINEVKTLLANGYSVDLPSMSSLGYLEILEYLDGKVTLEGALDKISQNTRNYAQRQLTWYRRYDNIWWVKGEDLASGIENPEIAQYKLQSIN